MPRTLQACRQLNTCTTMYTCTVHTCKDPQALPSTLCSSKRWSDIALNGLGDALHRQILPTGRILRERGPSARKTADYCADGGPDVSWLPYHEASVVELSVASSSCEARACEGPSGSRTQWKTLRSGEDKPESTPWLRRGQHVCRHPHLELSAAAVLLRSPTSLQGETGV